MAVATCSPPAPESNIPIARRAPPSPPIATSRPFGRPARPASCSLSAQGPDGTAHRRRFRCTRRPAGVGMGEVMDASGRSVLAVGAGPEQVPTIEVARNLGLRVVAVDRDPAAPGMVLADVAAAVD